MSNACGQCHEKILFKQPMGTQVPSESLSLSSIECKYISIELLTI